MDYCIDHLKNKHVRTHPMPIANIQEAAAYILDTEDSRQAYDQKIPIGFDIFNK